MDWLKRIFGGGSEPEPEDMELPESFEEAKGGLIPLIDEMADIKPLAEPGEDPPDIPHETLNADLGAVIAWNDGDSLYTLGSRGFENWGVGFEDAYAAAKANLGRHDFAPFEEARPGLMALEDAGGFASSALLEPGVLEGAGIEGQAVVMVPQRNVLLAAGRGNAEGLANMAELAGEIMEAHRPISGLSFVREGGAWRRFPRLDEDAAAPLRSFNCEWLENLYSNQAVAIARLQEKALAGENDALLDEEWIVGYPSSVTLIELEGRVFTSCGWGKGLDSLLPETDYVLFHDHDDEESRMNIVPWAAVREAFGHLMTPVGLHPERYFVEESPYPEGTERLAIKLD